jgi:hypothetical protein
MQFEIAVAHAALLLTSYAAHALACFCFRALGAVWFTKYNINGNGNDSHLNIGGNKFE